MKQRVSIITLGIEDIPRSRAFYEALGFVPLEGIHEGHLHGTAKPMFLAIQHIAAALED